MPKTQFLLLIANGLFFHGTIIYSQKKFGGLGPNLIPANINIFGYNVNNIISELLIFVYCIHDVCYLHNLPKFRIFCLLIFQNWYELQLQQIQQWLEKRPEFSLHAAQVQASRALTDVRKEN